MFLIVGMIQERTGTTELDRLGGMAKTLPFISGVFLIAGMASLGLPATSGFVAEFLAFLGLFDKYPVIAIVGTLGIVLTAVYVLRAVLKITFGPTEPAVEGLRDARYIESAPMVALVALILLLGIYPAVLTDMLNNALHLIMRGIGG
jgi:NADH-quinone oxidoreductase subunit M